MPLAFAPQGEVMKVVRIAADKETVRHLNDLGITSGAEITVLSHSEGSAIIRVHDSRLALDRKLARSVFVG